MPDNSPKYSDAVKTILNGLIDYACLFPPGNLEMSAAVSNFVSYRNDANAWMLGRFLLPASCIDDFENMSSGLLPGENSPPISLSVTAGDDLLGGLKRVVEFNNGFFAAGNNVVIDSMEFSALTGSEILNINNLLPSHLFAYYDVPPGSRGEELVDAVALAGGRVKLRIGETKSGVLNASSDILRYFDLCSGLNIPITIRLEDPFPRKVAGGSGKFLFLNLFLAAAFLRSGMGIAEASQILDEDSPGAFFFDEQGITWRGFRLDFDQIKSVRENFLISFGVGSFIGFVSDLESLHLL
jgi:hypothetical protein